MPAVTRFATRTPAVGNIASINRAPHKPPLVLRVTYSIGHDGYRPPAFVRMFILSIAKGGKTIGDPLEILPRSLLFARLEKSDGSRLHKIIANAAQSDVLSGDSPEPS